MEVHFTSAAVLWTRVAMVNQISNLKNKTKYQIIVQLGFYTLFIYYCYVIHILLSCRQPAWKELVTEILGRRLWKRRWHLAWLVMVLPPSDTHLHPTLEQNVCVLCDLGVDLGITLHCPLVLPGRLPLPCLGDQGVCSPVHSNTN